MVLLGLGTLPPISMITSAMLQPTLILTELKLFPKTALWTFLDMLEYLLPMQMTVMESITALTTEIMEPKDLTC